MVPFVFQDVTECNWPFLRSCEQRHWLRLPQASAWSLFTVLLCAWWSKISKKPIRKFSMNLVFGFFQGTFGRERQVLVVTLRASMNTALKSREREHGILMKSGRSGASSNSFSMLCSIPRDLTVLKWQTLRLRNISLDIWLQYICLTFWWWFFDALPAIFSISIDTLPCPQAGKMLSFVFFYLRIWM